MRLMVKLGNFWLVGIDDWRNTFMHQWQRLGWECEGCETKLVPR